MDGQSTALVRQRTDNPESLPITVRSTISRLSIGISLYRHWEENKFDPRDKGWSEHEGVAIANNQTEWYITKARTCFISNIYPWLMLTLRLWQGDHVSKQHPVTREFYTIVNLEDTNISATMIQCDSSSPPQRCDESVTTLDNINATLTPTALANATGILSKSTGKVMRKVEYVLEMVPSGATVEFQVRIKGEDHVAWKADVSVR